MAELVNADEAIRRVAALPAGALVGIDGLPVAGKSTLAQTIVSELGFEVLSLDDFVLPERLWPTDRRPSFPFAYIRYDEFEAVVLSLGRTGRAEYRPFDWSAMTAIPKRRLVTAERGVVIEGVSALNPTLSPLYSLRIFVESNRKTLLAASLARGVGTWETEWRTWFLPSVDCYVATDPAARADLLVAGRGLVAID